MKRGESRETHLLHGVRRIVSGGQTGVDQAALDAAIELNIPHGGWCPRGRLCETGRIPSKYRLEELPSPDYAVRTQQNVIDSDGTLILYQGRLQGGTALTYRMAQKFQKPVMRVRLGTKVDFEGIVKWLSENKIRILNVAGPRGSSHPELHRIAKDFLMALSRYQSPLGNELFDKSQLNSTLDPTADEQ